MNPPVGDKYAKESNSNTIQVKTDKEDLQAQKDSKFQTFGTLDKNEV